MLGGNGAGHEGFPRVCGGGSGAVRANIGTFLFPPCMRGRFLQNDSRGLRPFSPCGQGRLQSVPDDVRSNSVLPLYVGEVRYVNDSRFSPCMPGRFGEPYRVSYARLCRPVYFAVFL